VRGGLARNNKARPGVNHRFFFFYLTQGFVSKLFLSKSVLPNSQPMQSILHVLYFIKKKQCLWVNVAWVWHFFDKVCILYLFIILREGEAQKPSKQTSIPSKLVSDGWT
jgi:hypothetical protein